MGDFKTTSYQADYLKKFAANPEQQTNIYYNIPDQFVEYESKAYNPFYFFTNSGEFNLNEINKSYRLEQIKRMKFFKQLEEKRLANTPKPKASISELSLAENIKLFRLSLLGMWSDIITQKTLNQSILTKDNRMFYLGILLIVMFLFYLLISQFIS